MTLDYRHVQEIGLEARLYTLDVSVETCYAQRRTKPTFGYIEGVKAQLVSVSVLGLHDLHICFPDYFDSLFNSIPELSLRIVRIHTGHLDCFWFGHLLLSVFGKEVIFDVHELPFLIYPVAVSVMVIQVLEFKQN